MRLEAYQTVLVLLIAIQGCCAGPFPIDDQGNKTSNTTAKDVNKQLKCCEIDQLHQAGCVACQTDIRWETAQASLLKGVLTDFSGRNFTFDGSDEESYNLFTEADHQLNVILSNGKQKARQLGLTLRGVGIHGPDTRVKISVSDQEQIEVAINERRFGDDATRLDGVVVNRGCPVMECINSTSQESVTVKDRFFTLVAWVVLADGKEPLSLAFLITLNAQPMSQVHGILGQSLEGQGLYEGEQRFSMPSNLQFYGEGQISDYSTTDLFSSDSTFSIFTRKAERRRLKRKRQMLEGNALASMAFAAKAESGANQSRKLIPK